MNYTRNWRLTLIFLKVVVYYNFGDDLSVFIFRSLCERLRASINWMLALSCSVLSATSNHMIILLTDLTLPRHKSDIPRVHM